MDRSNDGVSIRAHVPPHAEVLGVEAQGLSGVAESLAHERVDVTGPGICPDGSATRSRASGVRLRGESEHSWSRRTRLLVHGPEIGRAHPNRLGALRRGARQQTLEGWLAEQLAGRQGVAFSGGRDASASAAMAGLILTLDGQDPSLLLGTPSPQLGGWARVGQGLPYLVDWPGAVESLGGIGPLLAVLLGSGGNDPAVWAEAVGNVTATIQGAGTVLALGHPSWMAGKTRPEGLEWLSLRQGADWWATDLREDSGRFRFRIFHQGRYVIEVRLRAPGLRYVVGALAATAACEKLGVEAAAIRRGLEEFSGLSRDFEARGSFRGVTLMDDEATDPGTVYDALSLARRVFRGRRLWVVFAPAEAAVESAVVARRYVAALTLADRVTITDGRPSHHTAPHPYPLSAALDAAGVRLGRAVSIAEAISELDQDLEPGDVLLTLGAGDVGTIADAFIRRLPRDRPGR